MMTQMFDDIQKYEKLVAEQAEQIRLKQKHIDDLNESYTACCSDIKQQAEQIRTKTQEINLLVNDIDLLQKDVAELAEQIQLMEQNREYNKRWKVEHTGLNRKINAQAEQIEKQKDIIYGCEVHCEEANETIKQQAEQITALNKCLDESNEENNRLSVDCATAGKEIAQQAEQLQAEIQDHQATMAEMEQQAEQIAALDNECKQWAEKSLLRDLDEDGIKAENQQLKEFEDYSYYVGGEVMGGRVPKKYCAWVDERKALAAQPQKGDSDG